MIERKTGFVLGAGAHAPYGFPTSERLISDIAALLPEDDRRINKDFPELVLDHHRGHQAMYTQTLVEFRTALMGSGHTSIDNFLGTNAAPPGFAEIGKPAVAFVLLPLDDLRRDFARGSIPSDWMSGAVSCSPAEKVYRNS